MVVRYKLDMDMAVTSEGLNQELQKYVEDHDGYTNNLKLDPSSISFEGKTNHILRVEYKLRLVIISNQSDYGSTTLKPQTLFHARYQTWITHATLVLIGHNNSIIIVCE